MFDITGILVLVVLVGVGGFLTKRAWKLKNTFLKWGGVIMGGLVTLVATVALILGGIGFYKLNQHHDNPLPTLTVAGSPDQIARGEQLAHVCISCHTPNNQLPLSGTNFVAQFGLPPVGTLYAPNLTPTGDIKVWSDGEIMRAIREGVYKDGRSLLIMPANNFRYMSDVDVQALVAYLRAQPASGAPTPKTRLNFFGAIFTNLIDFRTAQPPVASIPLPQAGTPDYGKYMVKIIGCSDCHGPQLQGRIDNGQPGPPAGPNLTAIIPQWSEEQFMTYFNTGTLPGGGQTPMLTLPSGFTEPRMPWPVVRAATTDAELRDMYAYLHSLPLETTPAQ
ncbi:MAG: c-type cytochrome [Caldilineaceae bacterium]|nr:c-type cytochrome [Caldilineaceae bacterium]